MQSGETPSTQDEYGQIKTPSVQDMSLELQQLVQAGTITPEQAQTIQQDPSAMNDVSTDPRLAENQMQALSGLQDISNSGGMTIADKANLNDIKNQEDAAARGKQGAILQNAQSRGMGGSGLELMSSLQNGQDEATRNSSRDLDVAGMAQARALQALQQQGQLSGQMQNQQFGQKAAVANANDAISRFNAQNTQQQANQTVADRNNAQAQNLASKQNISNQNTNLSNQEQANNKGLLQQNFNNQMAKAAGSTGVQQKNNQNEGMDSYAGAKAANDTSDKIMKFGGALAMSDERQKTDVKEFSPSDFLDKLTAKSFNYKSPNKFGKGKQFGVVAQDLEKSPVGSTMVKNTTEGKAIDPIKAVGPVLASLADIHKRLSGLEEGKKK